LKPAAFVVFFCGNAKSTDVIPVLKSLIWTVVKLRKDLVQAPVKKRTKPSKRDRSRKPKHGPRRCPGCGTYYNRFRAHCSFANTQAGMFVASEDSRKWRYKRRHSVLGAMHQHKTWYWNWHVGECTNGRRTA
jgi:hypothetical protein